MDCGMACLKYLLFIFNLLVSLLGLAVAIIGIIQAVNPDFLKINDAIDLPTLNSAVYLVIVVGVVMFLLGFFGCCGAFQENKCMLLTYVIIVTILLILQIVAAVLVLKTIDDEEIRGNVNNFLKKQLLREKQEKESFLDFLQSKLKCCGVAGKEDYKEKTIPNSCSKEDNDKKGSGYYEMGCTDRVMEFIKDNSILVGGITLGAFFVQLAACIISVCLYCSIKQSMGAIV